MTISLDGYTALIGGASRGIGWAIAELFAQSGATLILTARSKEELIERSDVLRAKTGRNHLILTVDYDNPDSLETAINYLDDLRIVPDIIINNAGGPPPGELINAHTEDFHIALNRLLLAAHRLIQYSLPHMKQRSWGRIVNIISTSVRQPIDGLGVSNTIRSATAAWAKTLATELAPYGITVNSILPGATRTSRLLTLIEHRARQSNTTPEAITKEMISEIPLGRFIEPAEIAYLALFLCSEFSNAITGECIRIDGGRTRAL